MAELKEVCTKNSGSLACSCIVDSLSHTTCVETNNQMYTTGAGTNLDQNHLIKELDFVKAIHQRKDVTGHIERFGAPKDIRLS